MQRPTTIEQYIDLVQQALFETEELRVAMDYDMETSSESAGLAERLEPIIRQLKEDMLAGRYRFENRDLVFMPLINEYQDRLLPFKYLLKIINETHRLGLDVSV